MLHEPAAPSGKDLAADYKKRVGLQMLVIYTVIYAGFVAVNVTTPLSMETEVLFGLNLACVWGMGLIVLALVLALVYDAMCRRQEASLNRQEGRAS